MVVAPVACVCICVAGTAKSCLCGVMGATCVKVGRGRRDPNKSARNDASRLRLARLGGLACLDVRVCRARDSISRRANGTWYTSRGEREG